MYCGRTKLYLATFSHRMSTKKRIIVSRSSQGFSSIIFLLTDWSAIFVNLLLNLSWKVFDGEYDLDREPEEH